jgi:hypothetical protein
VSAVDELFAAVAKLRRAAVELPAAVDLTEEYPDLDAAAEHLQRASEMPLKYALADLLEVFIHAHYMADRPVPEQAVAVARLLNPPAR